MSLGKFAVDAIKAWNPLGQEAYERRDLNKSYRKIRRKAKRGETLTEEEFEVLNVNQENVMAIDLGTRTSTNALVGGGILSQVYVAVVGMLPEGIAAALTTPEAIALAATVFAWIIARFSKTPAVPKAL